MDRVVLHSDLNNFYASVECFYRTELRDKPVAVGGDPEMRHGIVLAKNMLAKKHGVKTGQALWQARDLCPGLITLKPNYRLYLRYARMARKIYADYTDQIEPFGMDEAWLDVTASAPLYGSGKQIADDIRRRIREEMGVTASVGVSWNKIFAKLGSDMRKPDKTTELSRDNFKDKVWPLPAGELLYVGPATKKKLSKYGLRTIGDIAKADPLFLRERLGKMGDVIYAWANGHDDSPVTVMGEEAMIKSIGNSTTTPRDLVCNEDVSLILYVLSESVAMRLREHGLECRVIEISVRDNQLFSFVRQAKRPRPTDLAYEIHRDAMALFAANYNWAQPIRSIGVRGSELSAAGDAVQLSLLEDETKRDSLRRLEITADHIRRRYGTLSLVRGRLLSDRHLGGLNPKDDHIIHPVGYF